MIAILELVILGFLKEGPLHGYELKQRLTMLTGYYQPVSDGALYPAIARLTKGGLISRQKEPGKAGVPRQTLSLTAAGETEFLTRLSQPDELTITNRSRFFTLLAFIRYLAPDEQFSLLTRRMEFLRRGKSFFLQGGKPPAEAEATDYYRVGMLQMAKGIARIEREWLTGAIARLTEKEE
ncbi:MAG TPA: PadR family transcriptional regulator [Selenomonadales bacterium]|nr:PadR family transcriptional regulator [Selenomonadales bacterium]